MFITEDDLESLEPEALLDKVVATEMELPEFILSRKPLSEEKRDLATLTVDDVGKEIEIIQREGTFSFPRYYEKEEPLYKKGFVIDKTTKKTVKMIPIKGYFVMLDSMKTESLFGVVTVRLYSNSVSRKDTDWQFDHEQQGFFVDYVFMYLPEEKIYQQINMENKDNENYQEFERRKELEQQVLSLYGGMGRRYQRNFLHFYNSSFVADSKKSTFEKLFKDYRTFLTMSEGLNLGLNIRLLYSTLSRSEHRKITHFKTKLLDLITEGEQVIQSFEENNSIGVENHQLKYNSKDIDYNASDLQQSIPDVINTYIRLVDIRTELNKFRTPRPEQKSNGSVGYIDCDVENEILYPNIAEVERRSYFTDESMKLMKELEIQKEVIEYWKKGKSV